MAVYCPRCGNRWLRDPRFCTLCADGEANPDRAREIVAAAVNGEEDALRLLDSIDDRRAVPVLIEAAIHPSTAVRRAALRSLAWAADDRALPTAVAALGDDDEGVRRAAIECLAELGSPGAADALADHLADHRDFGAAATALAWLRDPRAREPLLALIERPFDSGNAYRGSLMAFAWMGDARDVPPLTARLRVLGDRWLASAGQDPPRPDWGAQSEATSICTALHALGGPEAGAALELARAQFGDIRLAVPPRAEMQPFTYRAPPDPSRTVPRWSLQLQPTLMPVTDAVTKFGGQPVWIESPTWPLGTDGEPMTFWAQFAVPGVEGLAYLFIDYSEQNWSSPYDGSALILQPGPAPERFAVQSVGPSYASEFSEIDRYVIRSRRLRVESVPTLEEGFDPVEWRWDEAPEGPDDDRDWNKVGGSPRYLQGGPPDPERLHFLFQFTAATVGHELADGAECYGLMDEDRRGWFFFESH